MINKHKEQIKEEDFIINYIMFKNLCIQNKIFDINEIIKLYGVYTSSLL